MCRVGTIGGRCWPRRGKMCRRPPSKQRKRRNGLREYNARRAEAAKKKELRRSNLLPTAPYRDWANKIAADWQAVRGESEIAFRALPMPRSSKPIKRSTIGLKCSATTSKAKKKESRPIGTSCIDLKNWRDEPEAKGVPFVQSRIATKNTETSGQLKAGERRSRRLTQALRGSRWHLDARATGTSDDGQFDSHAATYDSTQTRLDKLNVVVTIVTIGVGVCLLLGFFTRLASIVGALFLLGVIASQPFWIAESVPTINQCIEMRGLLVLAGTGAGRWFGLDALTYAMFHREPRGCG